MRACVARGEDPERATALLKACLVNVVGPAGFDVLIARAVVLAGRSHPFLAGIAAGPDGEVKGLREAVRDPSAIEDGIVAVVSHLIEVLAVLVGEDLAMRLLRKVWPEGWSAATAPPEEEKE